jgi:hypothetical protein
MDMGQLAVATRDLLPCQIWDIVQSAHKCAKGWIVLYSIGEILPIAKPKILKPKILKPKILKPKILNEVHVS